MRAGAVIILLALAIAVGTAIAVVTGSVRIPERWNPWAPLRVDEPHGLLTRFKLMRISADPALCRAVLAGTGLRYAPVEDRRTGEGCGFDNAVKITQTSAQLATPITLSCRAAVSLALWERHVLQPAAQRRFGQRVARIEHFGSYACLNVGNAVGGGRRSRHATADAFDIAGFVLSDGHRIRVAQDGIGPPVDGVGLADDDEEARLLREVHAGACDWFSTVLGPAYNAAHRDHLHVDLGAYGICR